MACSDILSLCPDILLPQRNALVVYSMASTVQLCLARMVQLPAAGRKEEDNEIEKKVCLLLISFRLLPSSGSSPLQSQKQA